MKRIVEIAGMGAAALGILLCAAAGAVRIFSQYTLLNFELLTIFQVGIALMVVACVLKLYAPES